jgi:segregation and condensation protein A
MDDMSTASGGAPALEADAFVVDLDGFEGPLDLLLALARQQRVDLARISILALADQYLAYLRHARERNLEIAADYLVMAAWLAYLKSRLLLPAPPEDEPDANELAEELQRRLQHLEAIRRAAEALMARELLGRDRLARGRPEGIRIRHADRFAVGLAELLDAYRRIRRPERELRLVIVPPKVHTMDEALQRITGRLGGPAWQDLLAFLPQGPGEPLLGRSAIAASLAAGLELARSGQAELRQSVPFGAIQIRKRP